MPLVDPMTGMPIGDPTPSANTIGGQVGMDTLGTAGLTNDDLPLAYDMLSSLPSASATMGWNVSRVQNTIMNGGRGGAQSARGIRQTASPLAWRRLARPANIDPTIRNAGVTGRGIYSPFNFLSSTGNAIYRNAHRAPGIGPSIAARMGSRDGLAFSPGTVGRLATMNRIGSMSESALASRTGNIISAISDINPNTTIGRPIFTAGGSTRASSAALQGELLNTITGKYSARATGFIRGAELYNKFGGAESAAFQTFRARAVAGNQFAAEGIDSAAKFMGRNTLATRAVGSGAISGAARAAGPIGWILLAKDLATMGGKLAGAGINLAIDAGKSMQGSINKPAFGMGFRDNTVTATSRQRGVMAIQNSRLNMRSALGSEAAYMHARFG
jgi:hypothetical protein